MSRSSCERREVFLVAPARRWDSAEYYVVDSYRVQLRRSSDGLGQSFAWEFAAIRGPAAVGDRERVDDFDDAVHRVWFVHDFQAGCQEQRAGLI